MLFIVIIRKSHRSEHLYIRGGNYLGYNKLLTVDLFSGAGGLSLGFVQTGLIQIIAAAENDKSAQRTYKRNHGENIIIINDIRQLDQRYEEIIERCKLFGKNRVDLVIGGPPCQGFSNANRQKNDLISYNNQLVKEYVRAIKRLEPDAFVMENVKAMQSSKHKFFYSTKELYELNELGIQPQIENITIGDCTDEELVTFIYDAIEQHRDLSEYLINDEVLYSKLRKLSREKDLIAYLKRNYEFFAKCLNNWDRLHCEYWNEEYKRQWLSLGSKIQNSFEFQLFDDIKAFSMKIIETQKILRKINEIIINDIEVGRISIEKNSLCIEVKTYRVLEYLIKKFKKFGYKINEENLFLNAANFGVPQLRERLFIIGVKSNYVDGDVKLPDPIIENEENFYTVKDAIEDLVNIEPCTEIKFDKPRPKGFFRCENMLLHYLRAGIDNVENHVITKTTRVALERFKMLKEGQNFHDLDEKLKETYSDPTRTQNTVYLRLNYNAPSGTVLNVRKSMWVHPKKSRAISIREAARLQSFPDSFVFKGSKDSQYQQIGNAVPPLLGRAVAEQVLLYLGHSIKYPLKDVIT